MRNFGRANFALEHWMQHLMKHSPSFPNAFSSPPTLPASMFAPSDALFIPIIVSSMSEKRSLHRHIRHSTTPLSRSKPCFSSSCSKPEFKHCHELLQKHLNQILTEDLKKSILHVYGVILAAFTITIAYSPIGSSPISWLFWSRMHASGGISYSENWWRGSKRFQLRPLHLSLHFDLLKFDNQIKSKLINAKWTYYLVMKSGVSPKTLRKQERSPAVNLLA